MLKREQEIARNAIADVISWNVWQMDGLKKTVPGTDIPCKIKDWKSDKEILFKDVGEEDKNENKRATFQMR